MRCFTFQGSEDAFCCTGGLSECAALNPAAVVEAREKEKKRAERRAARKAKKEAKKAAKLAKENGSVTIRAGAAEHCGVFDLEG